jgi:hypothetical protein
MDKRIREYDDDKACYLISLDCNFGSKQSQLILEELKGMDDESNEYAQLAYSFLDSMSSLYGGGITFVFDERILYLRDEVVTRMLDELDDYFLSTDFMSNLGWIHSVENELDDLMEHHGDNLIQSYLDANSECAYTVNKNELHDIFGEKFSKDEIDKVIIFNVLKNPELFSN